ncbi:MAG: flagellar biosynthetic protein FliR [Bacteriovoracaceae bacterium]|nr:flagellar biosynthetic protein FliR [Bacteriovoracaceae bacterium]
MINIQIVDYPVLIAFWLAFTRLSAIIIQLPLFSNVSVPQVAKVLTVVVITYAFFDYISPHILKDIQFLGVDNFWALTLFNAIVGLIIGYFVKIIMFIFTSSGTVISQQMGFGALQYFDPSAGHRKGPFEKLIEWTVLILILSTGALYPMFRGIFNSFESIHVYNFTKFSHSTEFFVQFGKSIIMSALMLASPLIFINVLIMSVLGIIARTIPQMNVLMVSFVINIGLGLLVFTAISDEFFQVAYRMYTEKLGDWFQFIM